MIDKSWKTWQGPDGTLRAAVKGDHGQVKVITTECSLDPDEALDFANAIAEAGAIQGTMLGSMGPDDKGGWTVQMQPSPGLTRRMVAFLCEWLGPAENYTETRIGLPFDLSGDSDLMEMRPKPAGQVKPYVLTVHRAGGKTPHEKRIEAEQERDRKQESANRWALNAAKAGGQRDEAMEALEQADAEAHANLERAWATDADQS